MDFKTLWNSIILLACAIGIAYFLFAREYLYAGLLLLPAVYFLAALICRQHFLEKQYCEFSEAVKYRDFTRCYSTLHKSPFKIELFTAFNHINRVYQDII